MLYAVGNLQKSKSRSLSFGSLQFKWNLWKWPERWRTFRLGVEGVKQSRIGQRGDDAKTQKLRCNLSHIKNFSPMVIHVSGHKNRVTVWWMNRHFVEAFCEATEDLIHTVFPAWEKNRADVSAVFSWDETLKAQPQLLRHCEEDKLQDLGGIKMHSGLYTV